MDTRALAPVAVGLRDRENKSAVLSPLPDRREVFAAEGPKDDFGSCVVQHDFEPRGVLDSVIGQARLIVDVDLRRMTKPRAECLGQRLHQFSFKLLCFILLHSLPSLRKPARGRGDDVVVVMAAPLPVLKRDPDPA